MAGVVFLLVMGVILLWVVIVYNRFIRLKALTVEAWSGIDVQLKRRHDLIPNLVESVKAYSQYEKSVFEDIARIRGEAMNVPGLAGKATAENALSAGIRSLFAVAEAYPDLKASQNFLDLQRNLAAVEEQLQLARRYYNGTVRDFNILVQSFPSLILAGLFNYRAAEFFEVETATQRETPAVRL